MKQRLLGSIPVFFLISALILTSGFNTAPAPAAVLTTYTFDGFEDGLFADTAGQPGAGYGWNDTGWTPSGTDAFILNSETPIGSYHTRIQKPNTYITRTVDLGLFASARLRFWYKTKSVTSNYGYVTLSTVGVAPWTYSFQGLSPQPTTHTEYVVDVPAQFVGKVVSLKFGEAGSQSRAYVYWDSISIESLDPLNTPPPPPVLDPHQVVNTYGRLQISSTALKDQNGNPIQLAGMSSHGLTWFPLSDLNLNTTSNINTLNQQITFNPTGGTPFPYTSSLVGNMVTQWHIQVIRASMFPYDPWNGAEAKSYDNNYPAWKWYNINLVNSIVQSAIDQNIYVIIDWHAGEGNDPNPNVYWTNGHVQEFFTYMVDKWGSYPNVIYETVNSPNNTAWVPKGNAAGLKTYNQNVINHIRSRETANGYAPNMIIVGTPTFSQDVDIATNNPVTGDLIAYNFMWYAGTHGISIRSKAETALVNLASNAPNQTLFMSEVGTSSSDGTGGVFYSEFNTWMEWAKTKKLSWLNWSIANKEETSAIFVPAILGNVANNEIAWRGGNGANILEALASTGYPMRMGPWADTDYSCSGKFVRGWIMNNTSQPVPAGCP